MIYFFEYLGAFYKWAILYLINSILRREAPSFNRILNPERETQDIVEILGFGLSNKLIGFIVTMIICAILISV